jgi:hypothetical protein
MASRISASHSDSKTSNIIYNKNFTQKNVRENSILLQRNKNVTKYLI